MNFHQPAVNTQLRPIAAKPLSRQARKRQRQREHDALISRHGITSGNTSFFTSQPNCAGKFGKGSLH